ncbi:MAG: DUF11 domain-containing protein [Meiothermus sp.]|uniref:CARDB domain-containing protein n=1 Tax=Meiothermus sp. TaxID=1955249 RepID=UPI0025DFAEEF|nr:CARDB domain-containing protein [Meiothermus sp.]MCS7068448.1 DUF11 domain-containing protein [Meiothermus sp.]
MNIPIHLNRLGTWAALMLSALGLAAADLRISSYGYNPNMTVHTPNGFSVTVENTGPDPASNVRLKATLPGGAELMPTTGCTQAGPEVSCTLPNLAAGRSVSQRVRFTPRNVARVRVEFEVQSSNDNNPANNSGDYDASVFPQNVLEVKAGSANPAPREASKGQRNLPVLQFTLTNKTEFPAIFDDLEQKPYLYVTRILLKASGTGHDAKDLTAVRLYEDTNANGRVDAGERLVQTLVFPIDDGTLVLEGPILSTEAPESRQVTYLVTYDLDDQVRPGTLAALAGFGLLALGFLAGGPAQRRRRPFWLLMGLTVLTLGACTQPATSPPEPTAFTYGLRITAVETGSASDLVEGNLPINGATLTVAR